MAAIGNSLSNVLSQISRAPHEVIQRPSPAGPAESVRGQNTDSKPRSQAEVGSEGFVGSGLKLELELASGQSIKLDIRQSQAGALRHISFQSDNPLSAEDEALLSGVLQDLGKTVDALFNGGAERGMFDFANQRGIKEIDLDVQTDDGNTKSNFTFDTRDHAYGRKEVDGQWQTYNRHTGIEDHHNFALSRDARDAASSYGAMDYQWVIDQVETGVGTLGHSTGDINGVDSPKQQAIKDFFVSGVQALFGRMKKGQSVLEKLGANPEHAKIFLGQSVRAMSHEKAQKNPAQAQEVLNSLPDFKAHFYSKSENVGGADSTGEYKLAMEISQMSHISHDEDSEQTSHSQTRRLLVELERQGETTTYEYKWKRDERLDRVYQNGSLDKGSYWLLDESLSQTSSEEGLSSASTSYTQRSRYSSGHDQEEKENENGKTKYLPQTRASFKSHINTVA